MPKPDQPTYFVLSDTTFQPNKSLSLGRIVKSPSDLADPLNPGKLSQIDKEQIETVLKTDVTIKLSNQNSGKLSIFAKFASVAGASARAGYENSGGAEYIVKKLETKHFNPDEEFLKACFEMKGVKSYLAKVKFRKPIYMITGVKIAYGAKYNSENMKRKDAAATTSADVSGSGFQASVGGEGEFKKEKGTNVAWDGSDDFVFAVRLHEVLYEGSEVIGKEALRGGQLYSLDSEEIVVDATNKKQKIARLRMLVKREVDPKVFKLKAEAGVEDGDEEEGVLLVQVIEGE